MRALVLKLAPLALLGLVSAASAEDKVVNIYNWSDYIDPANLEKFTAETGIKVVYDNYDNNEIVETKLLAGGSGYDVVVPSGPNVARQIQAGTLLKLDKSKIPNLSHQWDVISKRLETYDPGNQYAVNYMWGTTGIGYNVDKIKAAMPDAPVDSWDMIFKPEVVSKFKDCGIEILDTPEELIPAALNYLKLNPDSKDQKDIQKAGELLSSIKPYILKFHSSDYIDALANGDICLAVGYSGDVLQAKNRAEEAKAGVNINYVIPKEGAGMWFDSFIIPADAPHPDAAYAFINFMLTPEVAAANSNYVFYANGNKDSQAMVDEAIIKDPSVYPDAATLDRLYTTTPYDAKTQKIVTRVWTAVKSGS
ncbi:MAG TPA: polyamine ABC transporter substrate-binding protein [Bauldia sp.]|nr:polyamine ABC transporter substrate-binding protein [Bauldia sp.]